MTKPTYKPFWRVLIDVVAWLAGITLGIVLFAWATIALWWFPVAFVVVFFVLLVSFVIWIDQEGTK